MLLRRFAYVGLIAGLALSSCKKDQDLNQSTPTYSLEFEMDQEEPGTVYHVETLNNGQYVELTALSYDTARHGKYAVDLPLSVGGLLRIKAVNPQGAATISTIVQAK